MSALQALLLGAVQGLTEFLPVSSSGHLVIAPYLLGWPKPGVAFAVAAHLGTLIAVSAYFAADFSALIRAFFKSILGRRVDDPKARLAWAIVIATIPAAVAGALLHGFFERFFDQPFDVAFLLVVTGAILLVGEAFGAQARELNRLGQRAALGIGLFQAVAILPGISRSGATMSAGLLFGLKREAAARFAFLLSAPIVLGTTIYEAWGLIRGALGAPSLLVLLVGIVSSALAGLAGIRALLGYVAKRSLYAFAAYCIVFGTAVAVYSLVAGQGA